MAWRVADVGEKIKYREIEVKVEDVGFLYFEDGQMEYASSVDGELHYRINNAEFGNQWVLATECDIEESRFVEESFFDQDSRSIHLQELGYNMLKWSEGLEERPDNSNLPPIVTLLMAIQYDKEGGYGSSWKGKGEYRGIMANIDRKYDRLDKMTQDEIEGKVKSLRELEEILEQGLEVTKVALDAIGESKIDAVADLTNYGLLYMTYVREHFPRVFAIWVERNVPGYLRDKIPFV